MNYEKLQTLVNLKNAGEITKDEFDAEKAKLYAEPPSPIKRGAKLGLEPTTYYMLQHISLYCAFFIPFFGIAVPVILWLLNKQEDKDADRHGRVALNWLLSSWFYFLCGIVLSGVIIGLIVIGVTLILGLIFPMIGAFRARNGQLWKYPLCIQFFPVKEDPIVFHPPYPTYPPQPFPPSDYPTLHSQEPPTHPPIG